jgi:S1-C subfamily serine protease
VIDEEGHIVTNWHVVQGASRVDVTFSEGDSVRATVVGVDPSTDLAVLDVDLPADALTPLPLGSSTSINVGDEVVAIGNPFGFDRTITKGIVSALHRVIQSPTGFDIEDAIQTDAAINHGNSGGPLLNMRGEVVGVNSQIETGGIAQGNVGVGFAVPSNTVRQIAGQLIDTGKVERAYLGVFTQEITPELARRFDLASDDGVLIARVEPGTPAADAGLRGGDREEFVDGQSYVLGGDIVTAVDGDAVATPEELRDLILAKRPGDVIEVEINRDGTVQTISIELGRRPNTPTG